jgi:3-phosphoshikimate 1-carboxyvinyltransferase
MAAALELKAVRRVAGTVRLPGSKSISNRVLLLAALASGETEVQGLLDAEDTRVMVSALSMLGAKLLKDADRVRVTGVGGPFPVKRAELFLGNAGTAFRPLTAALAFSGGEYRLSGVPRMQERPIGDLVDALRSIGARIDYLGGQGYPPLALHPAEISVAAPIRIRGEVSSQFLTAMLLALPLAAKAASVEIEGELVSRPYIEITLNTMHRFGIEVRREDWRTFHLPAGRYVSPRQIYVEGDASSASYFLAAGALGGGPVRVEGVGADSIQGDVRFAEVLYRMGARVTRGPSFIEAAQAGKLRAIDMDLNHIPDAAMTVAVLALFADGPSTLRNIASWRVKETDRLAAMAKELTKLGAKVEEGSDFLRIAPPPELKANVAIDTYDDHRMAMSFALLAAGGVPVRINDPACVAKTFPDFFKVFSSIAQ